MSSDAILYIGASTSNNMCILADEVAFKSLISGIKVWSIDLAIYIMIYYYALYHYTHLV